MTGKYRTHSCAELNESNLNKKLFYLLVHRKEIMEIYYLLILGSLRNYSCVIIIIILIF